MGLRVVYPSLDKVASQGRSGGQDQSEVNRAFPHLKSAGRSEEGRFNGEVRRGGESRAALWRGDSHQPLAGCPTAPITSGWVIRQERPGGVRVRVLHIQADHARPYQPQGSLKAEGGGGRPVFGHSRGFPSTSGLQLPSLFVPQPSHYKPGLPAPRQRTPFIPPPHSRKRPAEKRRARS